MTERSIAKILSANDTGETGGHQAGILVPKEPEILGFFPALDPKAYNPRCHLQFIDDAGTFWEFAFIYYNNALHGGTRNEYRLTRMTRYIREASLITGDEITLSSSDGRYRISHSRQKKSGHLAGGVLKLGAGWRVIQLKGE